MFTSIYLSAFLMDFMNSCVSIALALFLADMKGSSSMTIGLAGFVAGFSYTATTFLKARFFSGANRSWFIYTPGIAGLIYFSFFFVPVPVILVFLLLAGLFYGIYWPTVQYFFSGEEGMKRLGVFNLCWSGGIICGSFMAGHLYAYDPLAPFAAALAMGLAAMAGLYMVKERPLSDSSSPAESRDRGNAALSEIGEVRILSFLHMTSVGAIMFLFPKLGLERGFSPQMIGIMFATLLLFRFLTFVLLRGKGIILRNHTFIISCLLFSLGSFFTGKGSHPSIIFASMIVIGVTGAFSYHNSLILHLKHNLPTEIHEGIIGGGLFLGPLIAGFFGHIAGIQAAFQILGLIIIVAGIFFSFARPLIRGRIA